jgi:hypothetical protein
MRKNNLLVSLHFSLAVLLLSCAKGPGNGAALFYGYWETSYGDTIEFSRVNGKDMVRYNMSMNPTLPATTSSEYKYVDGRLGVNYGPGGWGGFHFFQSFRWIEPGRSFQLQSVEWFSFLSSTQTYFTFTKIR